MKKHTITKGVSKDGMLKKEKGEKSKVAAVIKPEPVRRYIRKDRVALFECDGWKALDTKDEMTSAGDLVLMER